MTVASKAIQSLPILFAAPARHFRMSLLVTGILATEMLATGTLASAQTSVPDAQVESNVLKALASAPELVTESITTRTMYGTVTLSGTVRDEATRRRAENLAANSDGVKKVIDELRLGSPESPASTLQTIQEQPQAAGMVLQSDGTYAPPAPPDSSARPAPGSALASMAQRNDPDADQQLDQQQEAQINTNQPPQAQAVPYPNRQPLNPQVYPYPQQQGYPPQQQGAYPPYNRSAPPSYAGNGNQEPMYGGGQMPGQPVVVPNGSLLRVRLNRTLSSNRTPAGTTFDGIVTNDVVADGVVAIPRGAGVQGTVLDAKSSGVLKGRGEMSIQLTSVTLGGKTYPIVSNIWVHHGGDKTIETVNKTAGFGAGGALLGALVGGGEGAAIGAGVGAALGLGSSAGSGNGQVFLPAEALVTFHLAQAARVQTVSEQEMQRLAYAVPAGADSPQRYRRYPRLVIGPPYYPGYYPGPYGPAY